MKRGSLLLVDDDRLILNGMSDWLREQGFKVCEAASCREAIAQIDASPSFDLLLVDIRLPDGDGFDVLAYCREHHASSTVILLTGYATPEMGVEAVRAGAYDLLTKPLIDDELEVVIDRALSQRRVLQENAQLRAQLDLRFGADNVVGRDHRMAKTFDVVDAIADTRATVLITGESGTGKSLIARAIHRRSSRRERPFVEVACGALPETLLESELFGHVAGAFTGALGERMGKFEQADGGSLFLDEIGTASPAMQVKLLRMLQDFEFEPVGGAQTRRVDVRVILATNEDLAKAVANGRFRQDLYYRINVINIELPPLRARVNDIPLLAEHFLQRICEGTGRQVDGFSEDALVALQLHSWPGNVRELQNVVERAVLLGKNRLIQTEDLPAELLRGAPLVSRSTPGRTLKQALAAPERQIILETLQRHGWNRHVTAEQLGINRTTLYKKMKRLGLDCPAFAGREG